MLKNKLNGVKPFNEFFFKSCYYHQLLAGISCFGIDKDDIILNAFTTIKRNFNAEKNGFLSDKKLGKLLGYKRKTCNINETKLIKYIDKGFPIIAGVDCYYLESRSDTYLSQHMQHFILVYGYDIGKGEVDIVDHQYQNSYIYNERKISMSNMLWANVMFRKGVFKRKKTCYILKRRKKKGFFDIWKYINDDIIISNRENSAWNINELKRMITSDSREIKEKINKIVNYLNNLKNFYFRLSHIKYLVNGREPHEKVMALINGYSNILSLFWKVRAYGNFDYFNQKKESILRKLNETEETEKAVYDIILEARRIK